MTVVVLFYHASLGCGIGPRPHPASHSLPCGLVLVRPAKATPNPGLGLVRPAKPTPNLGRVGARAGAE